MDCLGTDAWIRVSALVGRVMLAPYRFSDVVGGVVIVQLKCSRRAPGYFTPIGDNVPPTCLHAN